MNAMEIESGLMDVMGDRIVFLGCHPQNKISDLLNLSRGHVKPVVFILNTHSAPTDELGHWITIYINYQSLILGYFDSYNLHPSLHSLTLHHFMQRHPYFTIQRLRYRLQGAQSLVCGIYSMYFSYQLSHHDINRVLQCIHGTFKKGQYFYNDKLITKIGYNVFHMPPCARTFCVHETRYCQRHICDV